MSKKIYVKNIEVASKSYADSSFEAARSYTDTKALQAINTSNAATDEKLLGYVSKYECTEAEYAELTPQQKALHDLFIINPNPTPIEEYIELDYIEPGIEQYIDTGVLASSNIKIDLVLREPDLSISNGVIYGGGDDWMNNYLQGECDSNSTFAFGDEFGMAWFDTMGDTIHIVQDSNNVYINDNLVVAMSSASFTTNYSIYLFAYNRGGSIGEYGSYKLSSCKISENGTLLRDYIACYRTSDNKRGLYDRVNNEFYPLQGTNGYEDIDYVENAGQYYIAPNVIFDGNLYGIELAGEPTDIEHSGEGGREGWIFAAYGSDGRFRAGLEDEGNPVWRLEAEDWGENSSVHQLSVYPNTCEEGVSVTFTGQFDGYIGSDSPLTFFTQQENGEPYYQRWFLGKIYYAKVWQNNDLIRDLVPKRRLSDNIDGLYDLVNDVFYPLTYADPLPPDEDYDDEEEFL